MKKWGLVVVMGLLVGGCGKKNVVEEKVVPLSKFEQCVEAGGTILELSPRQCRDGEGNVYAEKKQNRMREATESGETEPKKESSGSGRVCEDECGNGICEEIVCQAVGCPCSETAISCPEDCE